MKKFSAFVTEAISVASQQAQKLGLQSDGHGDWYDRQGKLVAKTEKGTLKFFGTKKKSVDQEKPQQKSQEAEKESETQESGTLTVGFGRFNPPTVGHEKLLNHIKKVADKGEYKIYMCTSHVLNTKNYDLDYSLCDIDQIIPTWEKCNKNYQEKGYPYELKGNCGKNWSDSCKFCFYKFNNKILHTVAQEMPDKNFA